MTIKKIANSCIGLALPIVASGAANVLQKMKGLKQRIVLAALLICSLAANAQLLRGDMDDNGQLTIGDITLLIDAVASATPAETLRLPFGIPGQREGNDFLGLDKPVFICHRAMSAIECPENSVHAVRNAAKQGQSFVECDVQWTIDGVAVVCHDATINRTMNSRIDGDINNLDPISIDQVTWKYLADNFVYDTDMAEYRTRICTFEEWLKEVARLRLTPLLHNVSPKLIPLVQQYCKDRFIWMGTLSSCIQVRTLAPNCFIIYQYAPEQQSDGTISDIPAVIRSMKQIGGLCAYSSMMTSTFSEEFLNALKAKGFYAQFSTAGNYNVPEMLWRGCNLILANNWCNENLSYAKTFDLKLSQYAAYRRLLNSNETITIPFATHRRNIKVKLLIKGRANLTFNNESYYFNTHEEVKLYEIGGNTTAEEVILSIQPVAGLELLDIQFFEGTI